MAPLRQIFPFHILLPFNFLVLIIASKNDTSIGENLNQKTSPDAELLDKEYGVRYASACEGKFPTIRASTNT